MKPFAPLLLLIAAVFATVPAALKAGEPRTIEDFRPAAVRAGARLTVPAWPENPAALEAATTTAIQGANAALDRIAQQDLREATLRSTVGALDELVHAASAAGNVAAFLRETHPSAAMRTAAEAAMKTFSAWQAGLDYREDVYRVVKAFAETEAALAGEDARLLAETLRAYRRAGLDLPAAERAQVEKLHKELTRLCADFDANLTAARAPVVFTRAELDGVPDSFLASPGIGTGDDACTVQSHLTWQAYAVLDNAQREATRQRVYRARDSLAKDKNVTLLNQILTLRHDLARRLGYGSWADYQTEINLAKSGAAAVKYIGDLSAGTQSKFDAEIAELRQMKIADTGDPDARIAAWDWRYYTNRLRKEKFAVDAEALRVYFPLPQTLAGMFGVYERIFGLKFEPLAQPQDSWTAAAGVSLYVASDRATNEPLGLFYLDLLPREGKTGGGGESELVGGRLLADGAYQRPTVAVVLNFPPPAAADAPTLLSHAEVEILFHEFGHALHAILTRAKYARFAGTAVPRDFVEAPSQMLQNWVWDKAVLDTFAADYRDPKKKIPAGIIAKLTAARLATAGAFYRRQFAFALLDLALHDDAPQNAATAREDCVTRSNRILESVFLPIDPDTAFVASFRALNGYDAGYYGYAWADAIAADLATVFESAKEGYLDREAGLRLRREIYEPGGSRDITESVEKFLGRPRSIEPFLEKSGSRRRQIRHARPEVEPRISPRPNSDAHRTETNESPPRRPKPRRPRAPGCRPPALRRPDSAAARPGRDPFGSSFSTPRRGGK